MGEETLADRLLRDATLPLVALAPIIDDLLEQLAELHARGIVHRDVSPRTILVGRGDPDGRHAKLIDVGVVKVSAPRSKHEPDLTGFDGILGSFAFMAPEQVRGSTRVDGRVDVYAIGAVAFRALTGRLPFEGSNALALIAKKLDRPPPTLAEASGTSWPEAVERFVARSMATTRDGRFASAPDTLAAWRAITRP